MGVGQSALLALSRSIYRPAMVPGVAIRGAASRSLACAFCTLLGVLVTRPGGAAVSASLAAAVLVVGFMVVRGRPVVIRRSLLILEVPLVLLLLSGYSWRGRTAVELVNDPLDATAFIQVLLVGFALLLGFISAVSVRRSSVSLASSGFKLYVAFGVWALFGAWASVFPALTVFHAGTLLAVALVVSAAWRHLGDEALSRLYAVLFWFLLALIASVWLGALLAPGLGLPHVSSPIPFQLIGIFPPIASNGVGTIGAVLSLWSLELLVSAHPEPRLSRGATRAIFALSVLTLIASQYRTGYVMFLAGAAAFAVLRRRVFLTLVLVTVLGGLLLFGRFLTPGLEQLALRGQSVEQASQLSGRFDYWDRALDVWRESPWTGSGLYAASRIQVLGNVGSGEIATVHSTWVEALVGTGVVGFALLLLSLLVAWKAAIKTFLRESRYLPLGLLLAVTIRSLTGSSIEDFGVLTVAFVIVMRDTQLAAWSIERKADRQLSAVGASVRRRADVS